MKKYIEWLRVYSMLGVVAIHVNLVGLYAYDAGTMIERTLLFSICNLLHFAVPVFFMITGALMLDQSRTMDINKLWSKYIVKYLAVILIFGWGFAVIEEVFISKSITADTFLRAFISMIQGYSWDHMWYMYTLLGMMFIVPILRFFVAGIEIVSGLEERKVIYFLLIIMILFLSVFPFVEDTLGIKLGIEFPLSNIYILYILLGYWISQKKVNIADKVGILTVAIMGLLIVSIQYWEAVSGNSMKVYNRYSSPIVVLFSVCIFSLFYNHERMFKETNWVIKKLGEYSFGIYIIHMFLINIFYKLLKFNPFELNTTIGFLVVYSSVMVLCIISVWIMKRIPVIKKII